MSDKKHLSPSQITMFLRCRYQHYLRYFEGLKMAPGIALLFGKSAEAGLEHNYKQKIESHKDVAIDEVKDAFVQAWDGDKDNHIIESNDDPDGLRELGINLVGHYHTERAPFIQPDTLQEKILIEYEGFDFDLLGYIDMTTTDKHVIDNKTAKKSPGYCPCTERGKVSANPSCPICRGYGYNPNSLSFDHKFQLTTYNIGYEHNRGEKPVATEIDYLVKSKNPKIATAPVNVYAEDVEFFGRVLGMVGDELKLIGEDKLTPMPNRTHMLCTKKFCGFWEVCVKEFGGTVKD